MRFAYIFSCFLLFTTSCSTINPAGSSEYENPTYSDELKGYFYCGKDPGSAVFSHGSSIVWISEPVNQEIWYKDVSLSVGNPHVCNVLEVDFSPGLMVSPLSGSEIFVTHLSHNDVYTLDTETLKWKNVYTSESSIKTVQLSSDGETLYLGSSGVPWQIEAVSTTSWERISSVSTDWPVLRLVLSPDGRTIAAANSGGNEIYLFNAEDLSPMDTLDLPMRIGTMSFSSDSRSIVALDAASTKPYMIKVNLETDRFEYSSRPIHSYLVSQRIPGSNILLLPRNQDERVSVLNMDNMVFAPSIPQTNIIETICTSHNGDYVVTITGRTTPAQAFVFVKGE